MFLTERGFEENFKLSICSKIKKILEIGQTVDWTILGPNSTHSH